MFSKVPKILEELTTKYTSRNSQLFRIYQLMESDIDVVPDQTVLFKFHRQIIQTIKVLTLIFWR